MNYAVLMQIQHVLSADQFTRDDLDKILARSVEMETIISTGGSKMCEGKILGALFYEPSTRTRLSFEVAMMRLGGNVVSETDVTFSSQTKGEVMEDTIRIVGGYSDVIAIRTNIEDEKLKVAFVGDLKYGRTVHSLAKILRNYDGVELSFVAPEVIQMPDEYVVKNDQVYHELTEEVLTQADVIYDTRMQKERFDNLDQYHEVRNAFVFTPELVNQMKSTATLMHPLPRVNEIQQAVDALPQARYFEQALNGVPVRMALIAEVLGI